MIVVFAHTGGLVGAEIGVRRRHRGARPAESWRRSSEIRRFGDSPRPPKDDLDARVQALLADELLRYHKILDALGVGLRIGPTADAMRPQPWKPRARWAAVMSVQEDSGATGR